MDSLKVMDAMNAYNKSAGLSGSYKSDAPDFTEMVAEALSSTKNKVVAAEQAVEGNIMGEVSLDELAIAVANAETSLKTVVNIRDRIVSAYQDIIRMPI